MQFGVLVDAVLFFELAGCLGHAVWGAGGCCFASLTAGCWGDAVWAVDAVLRAGRVLGGMQFGVLVDAVLRA